MTTRDRLSFLERVNYVVGADRRAIQSVLDELVQSATRGVSAKWLADQVIGLAQLEDTLRMDLRVRKDLLDEIYYSAPEPFSGMEAES